MIANEIVYILNNQSLNDWIIKNQLSVKELNNKLLEIEDVGKFLLIEPKTISDPDGIKDDKIFDKDFQIVLSDEENENADHADFLLFQFGDRWYYTNDLVPEEIKEFKYLGKPNLIFDNVSFPHLGIHTGYELCNGSRLAKDWITKAKFLGVDTLGICEENTLAGTLAFQEECVKNKIKSVIGETISVQTDNRGKMSIKLYVKNDTGWKNLLLINKVINVDNGGEHITWDQFVNSDLTGLIIILTTEVNLERYWNYFTGKDVYFQLDFVEWAGNNKDEEHLKALKKYLDDYIEIIPPALICDSYYLEKDDYIIKPSINKIGKIGFKSQSKDQYFKSVDDIYNQSLELFSYEERWQNILDYAIDNVRQICAGFDFKIPVGVFRLPKYEMNEDQKLKYSDSEELFYDLIGAGMEEKVIGKVDNEAEYYDRLEEEVSVIKAGGFIDYFLILNNIINWCDTNGIWYGLGRGSAAGSLVSYLLGIVGINPLKYGLLFSRFLNAGRVGKIVEEEVFIIQTDLRKIELTKSNIITIERNNNKMQLTVTELQEGDDILYYI